MVPSGSNTHAFDIDAETEPIEETGHDMADLPVDLEDMAVEGAFAEDNAGQIRRVMPVMVSINTPTVFVIILKNSHLCLQYLLLKA